MNKYDELVESYKSLGYIPVFNPGCSDLDVIKSGVFYGGFLFPRVRQWFAKPEHILERGLRPVNGYTIKPDGSVVFPEDQPPILKKATVTLGNYHDVCLWTGRDDIKVGDVVEYPMPE